MTGKKKFLTPCMKRFANYFTVILLSEACRKQFRFILTRTILQKLCKIREAFSICIGWILQNMQRKVINRKLRQFLTVFRHSSMRKTADLN